MRLINNQTALHSNQRQQSLNWLCSTAVHIVQHEITQISNFKCQTSGKQHCESIIHIKVHHSQLTTHLINVNSVFIMISNVNIKSILIKLCTVDTFFLYK